MLGTGRANGGAGGSGGRAGEPPDAPCRTGQAGLRTAVSAAGHRLRELAALPRGCLGMQPTAGRQCVAGAPQPTRGLPGRRRSMWAWPLASR